MKTCIRMLLALALVLGGIDAALAETAVKGGTFVYGRGADSVGLDPAVVTDGESFRVTRNIYESLCEYQRDSTAVIPGLAESWQTTPDGLTWKFTLRRHVKFHDGTPFNAEAVVFNFERWMFEHHPYHKGVFEYWKSMFGGFPGFVKSVRAIDGFSVEFVLDKPMAPFLANLAMPMFGIASPAAIKKYGDDYFKNPVGTGSFRFREWRKDDRIVLERNADYWGEKALLDRVIFRSIVDNSARLLELQAGSIDLMEFLNPDDMSTVKNDANLQLIVRPSMNVGYLWWNAEREPFGKLDVRRAVAHAVNKRAIVEKLFGGIGIAAKNMLPPSLWGYNDAVLDYEYDPTKAREYLAKAGLPNGFKTKLWAMPNPRPYMPQPTKIAEAIQADLKAVGIEAEIVTMDWATYLAKTREGEQDMYMLGWTGDNGDPDNFLYWFFGQKETRSRYYNATAAQLTAKAQTIFDQEERARLYRETQVVLKEDTANVPIAHTTPPLAAKKTVQGFIPHATGGEKLDRVWLEKK
ncbi:MAG TPA: ABC transporter substrate-binding protein [Candidatus Tectomicrobia bacterium]|nr:ABC transporter substrate-binding protein [Candidatus Tectomicrobia bacterium]